MARLSKDSVKLNSSADLRAMRDAKSTVQPGPMLEAARRAQAIRDGLNSFANAIEAMAEAWNRDDWKTLGYGSWQEYCQEEFDPSKVRLTVEQRRQAVGQLTSAGLTKRAASAALGVSHTTVQNDARGGKKLPLPAAPEQDSGDVGEGVSGRTAGIEETLTHDLAPDGVEGHLHPPVDAPAGDGSAANGPVSGHPEAAVDGPDIDASADGVEGLVRSGEAPAGEPADVSVPPVGSPVTLEDSSIDEDLSAESQLAASSIEVDSPTGQPSIPEAPVVATPGQSGQDLSPEGDAPPAYASTSISLTGPAEGSGPVGGGEEGPGVPPEGPSSSQIFTDHIAAIRTTLRQWDAELVASFDTEALDALAELAADVAELHDAVVQAVKDQQ